MKKVFLTLIVAVLFLSGCDKSDQFKVTLNLDNADKQTVYLCKDVDGKAVCVDTAVFAGKKAVLKAAKDDPQLTYIIKFDPSADCGIFSFFTENQNTVINGDLKDMPHWTAKGCPVMNTYNEFHQQSLKQYEDPIMALYEEMGKAYEAEDTVRSAEINDQLNALIEGYFNNQIEFIKNHSDSYLAHFMLDQAKSDFEFNTVKELSDGFTTESVYSKRVKEYIKNLERVEVGAPFVDFTLKTVDGVEVNLAEVINNNKVTMVDFWASWCGPCRGENPFVKAAYEKYHAAGFEIVGVSVDRDEAAWLKAVADDGLTWLQVRDTENSAAQNYAVQYIPSNFLFDANGVMIAKGLRGEALEAKLAEVLQ